MFHFLGQHSLKTCLLHDGCFATGDQGTRTVQNIKCFFPWEINYSSYRLCCIYCRLRMKCERRCFLWLLLFQPESQQDGYCRWVKTDVTWLMQFKVVCFSATLKWVSFHVQEEFSFFLSLLLWLSFFLSLFFCASFHFLLCMGESCKEFRRLQERGDPPGPTSRELRIATRLRYSLTSVRTLIVRRHYQVRIATTNLDYVRDIPPSTQEQLLILCRGLPLPTLGCCILSPVFSSFHSVNCYSTLASFDLPVVDKTEYSLSLCWVISSVKSESRDCNQLDFVWCKNVVPCCVPCAEC